VASEQSPHPVRGGLDPLPHCRPRTTSQLRAALTARERRSSSTQITASCSTPSASISRAPPGLWLMAHEAPELLPGVPGPVRDKVLYAWLLEPGLVQGSGPPIPPVAQWAADAKAGSRQSVSDLLAQADPSWQQLIDSGWQPPVTSGRGVAGYGLMCAARTPLMRSGASEIHWRRWRHRARQACGSRSWPHRHPRPDVRCPCRNIQSRSIRTTGVFIPSPRSRSSYDTCRRASEAPETCRSALGWHALRTDYGSRVRYRRLRGRRSHPRHVWQGDLSLVLSTSSVHKVRGAGMSSCRRESAWLHLRVAVASPCPPPCLASMVAWQAGSQKGEAG